MLLLDTSSGPSQTSLDLMLDRALQRGPLGACLRSFPPLPTGCQQCEAAAGAAARAAGDAGANADTAACLQDDKKRYCMRVACTAVSADCLPLCGIPPAGVLVLPPDACVATAMPHQLDATSAIARRRSHAHSLSAHHQICCRRWTGCRRRPTGPAARRSTRHPP